MKIRIASRESKLAVIQSRMVMDALEKGRDDLQLELVTMKTTGDKILDRTLDQVGGKGLFVKELDAALRDGRADFTVHSLKDMPMEVPEDLPLAAFSAREDARDVLVLPQSGQWDRTKPIGCSSARRRVQLKALFGDVEVLPVRGNVLTRLAKLDAGEYGALVLAAAGMKRLGLESRISRYFTYEEMLPAAGQGILDVQMRAGTDASPLASFHDADAACCATAERAFVRTLDGGCSSPVAAFAEVAGDMLRLRGMYVSADETIVRKGEATGRKQDGEALGRALAERLRHGEGAQ